MLYQDCKYRMPCGWCDRHNRLCDIVQYEINKKNENPEKCEHKWRYEGQLGNRHHYKCIKCDTLKAVPLENIYSSTT